MSFTPGLTISQVSGPVRGRATRLFLLHCIGTANVWKVIRRSRVLYGAGYMGHYAEDVSIRLAIHRLRSLLIASGLIRAHKSTKHVRTIEKLIGARFWTLKFEREGPILRSLNDTLWYGPVMTADFQPTLYNSSGLYAFNVREGLQELRAGIGENIVFGIVEALGLVVLHEKGFRAERLVVRHLIVRETMWQPVIDALTRRYECSVATIKGGKK